MGTVRGGGGGAEININYCASVDILTAGLTFKFARIAATGRGLAVLVPLACHALSFSAQ